MKLLTCRLWSRPVLLVWLLAAGPAFAQGFPTPGGATGADTGDGSGPFTGIAGVPRANLFTGAATTSIAIDVPPGRGTATPRVELRYSSARGRSAYGYGWTVPLPRVSRSLKHGVPAYDETDTFVLEMPEGSIELLPVADSKRYEARVEGAYLRVGFDPAGNSWKVIDKSGTEYRFGSSASGRLGPDPATASGTFAWLVERTIDTFGNHVDYAYVPSGLGQGSSGLPLAFSYGGNLATGKPHIFSVLFAWGARPYPSASPVSYRSGFAQRDDRLLLAVETQAAGNVVRRYSMSHDIDPASGVARLVGVSLDGFADDPSRDVALPSTVFAYSPAIRTGWPLGSPTERAGEALEIASPGAFRGLGSSSRIDTFDVDGDARVDYVDATTNPPSVRRGTREGFAAPTPWAWPNSARYVRVVNSSNSNLEINTFDIDGDGLPDLVDARQSSCGDLTWCVYRNTGAGFETAATPWPAPRNDIRHAHAGGNRILIDVADLDGDGRPDWIDATTYGAGYPYWHVHWNTGSGFEPTPSPFRAHGANISRTVYDDPRYHLQYGLHDLNGDGLADWVVASVTGWDGYWQVYLNDGNGFSDSPLDWRIEGDSGLELEPYLNETSGTSTTSEAYKELVDVTGDGLPDWVRHWTGNDYLAHGFAPIACEVEPECTPEGNELPPACCFNALVFVNTGSSFSAPVGWPAWHDFKLRGYSESPSPDEREFDLFDFDGDGLLDLVEIEDDKWRIFRHPSSPLALGAETPDPAQVRPNLLVAMLNGIGGATHLAYMPAAEMDGNSLPFPYWTMTRREITDSVANTTVELSSYAYDGASYDAADREFRGFRLVWETDGIGRVTATEFHQDARRKGLVERASLLGSPGCTAEDPHDPDDPCSPWNNVLRVDTNAWPDSGPVLLSSRTSTPHYESSALPELTKSLTYAYDAFGNVSEEVVASPSATTVRTETTYAYTVADDADGMPGRYLVDKAVRVVTMESGTPLAEKAYAYDGASPVTGALQEASTCIDWSGTECARWSATRYEHDVFGNVVSITGPRGRPTTTTYDVHSLYAHTIENAEGHRTTTVRDLRTGNTLTTTDPNGQTFETRHDGLGRQVVSWRDGFSEQEPEIVTSYVEGTPGGQPGYVRTDRYGSAPAVIFYDGTGREIATKTQVETAGGVRTVIGSIRSYTPAGNLAAESITFEALSSNLEALASTMADAPGRTQYSYGPQGRVTEVTLSDGSRTLYDRSMPGVTATVHPNLAGGDYPGKATIELRDGLDRIWRKDECSAPPVPAEPAQCPSGALAARTDYVLDGLDRAVRIVTGAATANAAITDTTYDGLGNRTSFSSNDAGFWHYAYTEDGLLRRATDARGVVSKTSYDRIGRLRKQRAGDFKVKYKYHRGAPGIGLLSRVTSKRGEAKVAKQFTYDLRGRIVSERVRIRADGPTRTHTFRYTYDDADRRRTVSYPSDSSGKSELVRTGYSAFGRPVSLTRELDGATVELIGQTDYDVYGNITRMSYGNGVTDSYGYLPGPQLARLACLRSSPEPAPGTGCEASPQDLRRLHVSERDTAGNVLRIEDHRHPQSSSLNDDQSFSYDSLGRLLDVIRAADAESFAYDASGNLMTKNGAHYVYAGGSPHRAIAAGGDPMAYDANGNRTARGPWSYGYDELSRLEEVRYDGVLRSLNYYDEGRTRVARYDAERGTLRYYFGGSFELDGPSIIRHYYLGGRIVASDRIVAPSSYSLAAIGAIPREKPSLAASDHGDHVLSSAAVVGPMLLVLATLGAGVCTRGGRGYLAVLVAVTVVVATTPFPRLVPLSIGVRAAKAQPFDATLFFHPDHLGSPHLVTDAGGTVVEHRRYAAYGRIRSVLDASGDPLGESASELAFTGTTADESAGLLYFGSRFYDAELGLFLTPDPQAQFGSPYLYGGGNPVNGSDPNGEALFAFLAAVIAPIIVSSAITAFISGVAAALQGGDFIDGFAAGAVGGAIGAGLGTLVGGLNVAFQYAAGGSQYIEAGEALAAAVEVAHRASFTAAVTHSAVVAGQLAGLNSDWLTGIGIAAGLLGSYAYDNFIIKDSGATPAASSTQRELAKEGVQQVNTTVGHGNVTREAAMGTGWESYSEALVEQNALQDGPRGSFAGKARALLSNQDHFGRLPATIKRLERYATVSQSPEILALTGKASATVGTAGAASHFVQDYLTLGHMVPGTSLVRRPDRSSGAFRDSSGVWWRDRFQKRSGSRNSNASVGTHPC